MLVWQAVRAQELFRGCTISEEAAMDVYSELLKGMRNIVLIGMPSSGKTTVGQRLAAELGMPFTDTDTLVSEAAGMDIPSIFAAEGESGFRQREHDAIVEAASMRGVVIATGGGAVLREDNVRALQQSGIVCLLDRKPALLEPTEDRPLSQDREALERLFRERAPLYLAAADEVVGNNGTLDATISEIKSYVTEE